MTPRDEDQATFGAARDAGGTLASPAWLRPLGPDPNLADVAARAAVVGRMAGRVAALATDLQVLAMLLQEASGAVGHPATGATPSREAGVVAGEGAGAPSGGAPGDGAPGGDASGDGDPFTRAAAAIGALRAALHPGAAGELGGDGPARAPALPADDPG